MISKGDKCMWLKTIRGRHVSRREGSLFISSSSPFFSFSLSTYTLRDSRESIDIRGDEIGVLRRKKKKPHTQTRRRKKGEGHKWSIPLTQEKNEGQGVCGGVGVGGRDHSLCSMIYGSSSALSIWIAELVSELWQCFYQAYRTEKAQ